MITWLVLSGVAVLLGLAAFLGGTLLAASEADRGGKAAQTGLIVVFASPVLIYGGIISGVICIVVWIIQAVSA